MPTIVEVPGFRFCCTGCEKSYQLNTQKGDAPVKHTAFCKRIKASTSPNGHGDKTAIGDWFGDDSGVFRPATDACLNSSIGVDSCDYYEGMVLTQYGGDAAADRREVRVPPDTPDPYNYHDYLYLLQGFV